LHSFRRSRVVCATITVIALALYVIGSLENHSHPDARLGYEWPFSRNSTWFCAAAVLVVMPELFATAKLFFDVRHGTPLVASAPVSGAVTLTPDADAASPCRAVQALVYSNTSGPTETSRCVHSTSVYDDTSALAVSGQPCNDQQHGALSVEQKPSARGTYWLLTMLLLVIGCAASGLGWMYNKEGMYQQSNDSRFLTVLSAGMGTRVTTVCNANGTLTANAANICSLSVVACQDQKLVGLNLAGLGFRGSIPPFGATPTPRDMIRFDVSNNILSGTLPSSMAQLTNLELLRIDGNTLHGTLPIQLRNLTRLSVCELTSARSWHELPDNDFDPSSFEDMPPACLGASPVVVAAPLPPSKHLQLHEQVFLDTVAEGRYRG